MHENSSWRGINPQNVYNMTPTDEHYEIADWALAGNTAAFVGNSLFFYNPYSNVCPTYFPPGGNRHAIHTRAPALFLCTNRKIQNHIGKNPIEKGKEFFYG